MTNAEYTKLEEIYGSQTLTDEEFSRAILQAKIKKYFDEKHREYLGRNGEEKGRQNVGFS